MCGRAMVNGREINFRAERITLSVRRVLHMSSHTWARAEDRPQWAGAPIFGIQVEAIYEKKWFDVPPGTMLCGIRHRDPRPLNGDPLIPVHSILTVGKQFTPKVHSIFALKAEPEEFLSIPNSVLENPSYPLVISNEIAAVYRRIFKVHDRAPVFTMASAISA